MLQKPSVLQPHSETAGIITKLLGDMQEAGAWCDAWHECQGFTFSPFGVQNDHTPYAFFKGSRDGKRLDLCRSSLSPIGYVYIKEGQALVDPDGGDGGLSPAAIAGRWGLYP